MATARKSLEHFEQELVPKYREHARLSRENEHKLKSLLTKASQSIQDLKAEIVKLTVRERSLSGDVTSLRTQLEIRDEEAKRHQLELQSLQAEADARLRAGKSISLPSSSFLVSCLPMSLPPILHVTCLLFTALSFSL